MIGKSVNCANIVQKTLYEFPRLGLFSHVLCAWLPVSYTCTRPWSLQFIALIHFYFCKPFDTGVHFRVYCHGVVWNFSFYSSSLYILIGSWESITDCSWFINPDYKFTWRKVLSGTAKWKHQACKNCHMYIPEVNCILPPADVSSIIFFF